MVEYQIIKHGEAKICIIEQDYSIDVLLAALGDDVSIYEEDLQRIKSSFRKRDFIALRLALKQILNGSIKKIVYTDDGKPMLSDDSYKISFSHCSNCVAVMIHPTKEVGVDVEVPTEKLEKIHSRFLGKDELAFYNKTQSFDFLRIVWSTKEALYKIIGETAYNFAEQLQVEPFEPKSEACIEVLHTDSNKTYRVHYALTKNYTLAYSTEDE